MDVHERAELYRRGLAAGYTELSDAVAWADDVIAELSHPPVELIDFSLAAARRARDWESALARMTAGIRADALLLETVSDMRAALDRDESRAEAIAWALNRMAGDRVFPESADLPELHAVAHEFDERDASWATSREEAVAFLRATLVKLTVALTPAV